MGLRPHLYIRTGALSLLTPFLLDLDLAIRLSLHLNSSSVQDCVKERCNWEGCSCVFNEDVLCSCVLRAISFVSTDIFPFISPLCTLQCHNLFTTGSTFEPRYDIQRSIAGTIIPEAKPYDVDSAALPPMKRNMMEP